MGTATCLPAEHVTLLHEDVGGGAVDDEPFDFADPAVGNVELLSHLYPDFVHRQGRHHQGHLSLSSERIEHHPRDMPADTAVHRALTPHAKAVMKENPPPLLRFRRWPKRR